MIIVYTKTHGLISQVDRYYVDRHIDVVILIARIYDQQLYKTWRWSLKDNESFNDQSIRVEDRLESRKTRSMIQAKTQKELLDDKGKVLRKWD